MTETRVTPAVLVALAQGDLDNAIVASTPGGIEAQEAAGQQKLVGGHQLPISYGQFERPTGIGKAALMDAGVKFGVKVDDLFQEVELPKGWSIRPTRHPLHSELRDNYDRIRATIFYKAAFYDQRADINVCTRYNFNVRYPEAAQGPYVGYVTDGGAQIWESAPMFDSDDHLRLEKDDAWAKSLPKADFDRILFLESGSHRARKAARDYLTVHYPDWEQVQAYW